MTIDSDDMISLPNPPPPRPAARRAAIDAAMRRFDGAKEAPPERATRNRPARIAWGTLNRRPAGALVSAALIAIVFIPAMPLILRDSAPRVAPQAEVADQVQPSQDAVCAGPDCAGQSASEPSQPPPAESNVAQASPPAPPAPRAPPPAVVAKERREPVSAANDQLAVLEAPAPFAAVAAPPPSSPAPPPPPPPPPPHAEREEDGAENIVVTGSRVQASSSARQDQADELRAAAKATERSRTIASHGAFLSRLQVGLQANDRQTIVGLVGFPLRVKRDGRTQTYRSTQEVDRDFDRIFTPQLRSAVLNLRPDSLMSRDGGRSMGNGRLWFGCGKAFCSPDAPIRIREVHP